MIPEKALERLLGLNECREVSAAEYETDPGERFVLVVEETDKLWPALKCPVPTCGHRQIVCHDHSDPRVWRHLDAFGKRTEILCAPPRARCTACRHVWQVSLPWEGLNKHFGSLLIAREYSAVNEDTSTEKLKQLGAEPHRAGNLCEVVRAFLNASNGRGLQSGGP